MSTLADRLFFLRLWLRQPLRIAALAPSGKALAELMTARIQPGDAPVIELGAGTGVFTRALLARGVREQDLVLVESHVELAALLVQRYPQARVVVADAARLGEHYPADMAPAGAVVSGLPLLSMPVDDVARVLAAARSLMRDGAALYQFTYGLGCPVAPGLLAATGLTAERIGWVAANLPPASVYRLRPAANPCRHRAGTGAVQARIPQPCNGHPVCPD